MWARSALLAAAVLLAATPHPSSAFAPAWAPANLPMALPNTLLSARGRAPGGQGWAAGLRASMKFHYSKVQRETHPGISVWDVTGDIKRLVEEAGIKNGFVNVINQHTTTAVTINEYESRLVDDVRQFLTKLAPASDPYLHNDLHLRPATEEDRQRVLGNGWDISDAKKLEEWRAQEPLNAHSHLLGMLLGNSETIPVSDGKLCIGQWQSVMLVDIDGPRTRNLGIQVVGE